MKTMRQIHPHENRYGWYGITALVAFLALVASACGPLLGLGTSEPAGTVSFLELADGARVTSPFTVRMGATGLNVEPAGTVRDGYGHHHIVVDADVPAAGQPIPSDASHRHFGAGQTETVLDLSPGEHTLRLVFATGDHVPYDPAVTDTVKVTVVGG